MGNKENKYYTPEIEEFHVGFEYEIKHLDGTKTTLSGNPEKDKPVFKKDYKKEIYTIEDWFNIWQGLENNNVRVKYLDKEDIESLGFKLIKIGDPFSTKALIFKIQKEEGFNTGKEIIIIKYSNTLLTMTIRNYGSYANEECSIQINIKNKSELRKLLKQLNIL